MMAEIRENVYSVEGVGVDGERAELPEITAGSRFSVVAVGEDTVTLEAGNGTRFTVSREKVTLHDCRSPL